MYGLSGGDTSKLESKELQNYNRVILKKLVRMLTGPLRKARKQNGPH